MCGCVGGYRSVCVWFDGLMDGWIGGWLVGCNAFIHIGPPIHQSIYESFSQTVGMNSNFTYFSARYQSH